jgi:hypothetical protein
MNPHPRIRKTIKWGGAAVTVLLVVVWIASGWWTFAWYGSGGAEGRISRGYLQMACEMEHDIPILPGWYRYTVDDQRYLWHFLYGKTSPGWFVIIPFWMPVCVTLVITVLAWYLDTLARRRACINLCRKCNYDRTGLAKDAVCPECGAAAPKVV